MAERQKTKIIATLGDPQSGTYDPGIFDINYNWIPRPSLRKILDLFFENGVDIVRINLAHICTNKVAAKFRYIKRTMLSLEKQHNRRLGLLVDLPGPKIRFKSEAWRIPRDLLHISLDDTKEDLTRAKRRPKESTACVCLGEEPFAKQKPKAARKILQEIQALLSAGKPPLVFVGDNDCMLEVQSTTKLLITCKVRATRDPEALIQKKKGFTIRGVGTPIPGFTDEDEKKLKAVLDADYEEFGSGSDTRLLTHIGISFCQSFHDVFSVLHFVDSVVKTKTKSTADLAQRLGGLPSVIAKIETAEGVENIKDILDLADGVMIARGDLALQLPTTVIPNISKKIIMSASVRGKSSIMATQMLESMKTNIECSRPEASDVFNAVLDGVDALMLSGETSSGRYPAHAIQKMQDISRTAELLLNEKAAETSYMRDYHSKLLKFKKHFEDSKLRWKKILRSYTDAWADERDGKFSAEAKDLARQKLLFIADLAKIKNLRNRNQGSADDVDHAVCVMASDKDVQAIVTPTTSGRTARMLSRFRPRAWILAQSHDEFVARKMTIIWGVRIGGILPLPKSVEELMGSSYESLQRTKGLADKAVVFTCGTPLGEVGSTNLAQKWTASVSPVAPRNASAP